MTPLEKLAIDLANADAAHRQRLHVLGWREWAMNAVAVVAILCALLLPILLSGCAGSRPTPRRTSMPIQHNPEDGGKVMWLGSPVVTKADPFYGDAGYRKGIEIGLRDDGQVVWRYTVYAKAQKQDAGASRGR